MTTQKFKLPAGSYLIGDLLYALPYEERDRLLEDPRVELSYVDFTGSTVELLSFGADGTVDDYIDSLGRTCPMDFGMFGIIPSSVDPDQYLVDEELMLPLELEEETECWKENGVVYIGSTLTVKVAP